jgi:hypothetical protein
MNGTYTTHQVLILCDQDFAKIRTKIKFLGIFSRDEEFYIPYGLEVKDTGSLFLMAYSWITIPGVPILGRVLMARHRLSMLRRLCLN